MQTKRQLGDACIGLVMIATLLSLPCVADEFRLQSGASVRGDWLNPDKTSTQPFVVRISDGVELTLAAEQVEQVARDRPGEREYQTRATAIADDVEHHWQLAEWCRRARMLEKRQDHLRRILELDPQHVPARRALGYTQLEGRWITQAEFLTEKGYQYYKGHWRLRQEIQLMQEAEAKNKVEQEWLMKLRNWRKKLLSGEPHESRVAIERLRALHDPGAVGPLWRVLREDRMRRMRLIWVEVLGQIGNTRSTAALLATALRDADVEVFHACMEQLAERPSPELVRTCVEALRSKSNLSVNRAAAVLGALGDPSAVSPLIDALVTTHMRFIPGSSRSTFSFIRPTSGSPTNFASTPATGAFPLVGMPVGPQMSMPRAPQLIPERHTNQQVLDALVRLTKGTSFGFNQAAWRNWFAHQNQVSIRE